jgi:hypothetical protein
VAAQVTPREDWNRRVAKEDVLAAFGLWKFPWLDLPALIDQAPHIMSFRWWIAIRSRLAGDARARHLRQIHPSRRGAVCMKDPADGRLRYLAGFGIIRPSWTS